MWGAGGRPDPAGGADEGDVVGRGPGRGGAARPGRRGLLGALQEGRGRGARAGDLVGGVDDGEEAAWGQVGEMWAR